MDNVPYTVGVLADTHVPDRARQLNRTILDAFQHAGVQAILHAGDISIQAVLDQLSEIAPVSAVRGNRDWVSLSHLPPSRLLTLQGVQVGLTHGHGRFKEYFLDRMYYMANGYHLERFQPRVMAGFPQAQVIIFGHVHRPVNHWVGEQLVFNPGSAHFPEPKSAAPSIGLLHIFPGGRIKAELLWLE